MQMTIKERIEKIQNYLAEGMRQDGGANPRWLTMALFQAQMVKAELERQERQAAREEKQNDG